jgi:hypothetical protein
VNRVDPAQYDALTPYAVLAASAVDFDLTTASRAERPRRQSSHDLRSALVHHLTLFWHTVATEPGRYDEDQLTLSSTANELVENALQSTRPLDRFLARKRAELPHLVNQTSGRDAARAASTWSEIRGDQILSRAFDTHMVTRATTAEVFPEKLFARPVGVVVDVGGGPGHYLARALKAAGLRWRGVILETYPDAGWWIAANSDLTTRTELIIVPPGPISEPPPAHLYILGSVLHDLTDNNAKDLLSECHEAGHEGSWIVVIERDFDPADLRHSARNLDMNILFGGRERTPAEHKAMIESAGFSDISVSKTRDAYQVLIAGKGA